MNYSILSDKDLTAAYHHIDNELTDLSTERQRLDDAIEALEIKRLAIRAKLGRPTVWAKDEEYKAINARKATLKAKRDIVVRSAFDKGCILYTVRVIAGSRGLVEVLA